MAQVLTPLEQRLYEAARINLPSPPNEVKSGKMGTVAVSLENGAVLAPVVSTYGADVSGWIAADGRLSTRQRFSGYLWAGKQVDLPDGAPKYVVLPQREAKSYFRSLDHAVQYNAALSADIRDPAQWAQRNLAVLSTYLGHGPDGPNIPARLQGVYRTAVLTLIADKGIRENNRLSPQSYSALLDAVEVLGFLPRLSGQNADAGFARAVQTRAAELRDLRPDAPGPRKGAAGVRLSQRGQQRLVDSAARTVLNQVTVRLQGDPVDAIRSRHEGAPEDVLAEILKDPRLARDAKAEMIELLKSSDQDPARSYYRGAFEVLATKSPELWRTALEVLEAVPEPARDTGRSQSTARALSQAAEPLGLNL